LSSLLRPQEFSEPENQENEEFAEPQLWELPDTSILFRRYLDSGKMINVYDWFESFQLVLETQRKHLEKKRVDKQGSPKRLGKGKAKQVQQEAEEDGEDDEKWKIEVQARFMRALQELDYLGFIKHTGRKADHVMRTVYDIPD
jgi:origin recognition complex subunit 3